ncbi:MAG: helix-turn-helix domain-containing protein [Vicinamibacterales bacterium]
MTDPRSFGAWLRRERERRTITVRAIADRTKIGAGLLEALERGDVSRWPGGIYRRAFVRSYAEAVGLDADLVVANFERLFPADPATAPPAGAARSHGEQEEMRLALVTPAVAGLTAAAVKTACLDVACILAFGLGGLAAAGAIGFWCAVAVAAVVFHLSHTLGRHSRTVRGRPQRGAAAVLQPRAEVLSFADEQARSTSRRARARRALANLSAAASSAALPGRRRAARS